MSTVDQLVGQIKQSTDYHSNREILREKVLTDLHFTYNGGMFVATKELIAFVYAWQGTEEFWPWGHDDPIFIEDTYHNPIRIDNKKEFYQRACEHYQTVMNIWHQQHAELKKIRKV
jgi:hypothetical protein